MLPAEGRELWHNSLLILVCHVNTFNSLDQALSLVLGNFHPFFSKGPDLLSRWSVALLCGSFPYTGTYLMKTEESQTVPLSDPTGLWVENQGPLALYTGCVCVCMCVPVILVQIPLAISSLCVCIAPGVHFCVYAI